MQVERNFMTERYTIVTRATAREREQNVMTSLMICRLTDVKVMYAAIFST